MDKLIPLLLTLSWSSAALTQPNHPINKRQTMGFQPTINDNLPYPDQTALSSVNFNFNPAPALDSKSLYTSSFHKSPSFSTQPIQFNVASTPNSQLFNVGYSMRFKNSFPQPSTKPNLDNGEIITGTRKQNEQVQSPQQFATNALDEKQHKLSGIKPKPKFPLPPTKQENVYLSPITQKYLKDLEVPKPQLKTDDQKRFHDDTYSWKNLGPSVEIIRSSEIPSSNSGFNHASALGKSQSFDFSNGLDLKEQNPYQPSASNVYSSYNPTLKNQVNTNQQFLPPISKNVPSKPVTLSQLPTSQPLIGLPKANLPVDTRLIRDPYVTTNLNNVPSNPNLVPVHFDVRPLEEVMKDQLSNTQLEPYTGGAREEYGDAINIEQYQQQQQQQHQYSQPQYSSAYNTLEENQYGYQQKQNDNIYQNHEEIGYQEQQLNQNKYQYKIYGKPRPLKYKYKSYKDVVTARQPRLLNNYKMYLDLRPPPVKRNNFQRRHVIVKNVYA